MNPEGEDFYKPSGGTAVADAPSPQSVPSGAPASPPSGNTFTWTASEYIEHHRGGSWYLLLALATAVLAAGIYFLTKEYFTAAIILVVGLIVGIYARQKPKQVTYELTSTGLRIGEKLYTYGLFKSFSTINEDGVNSVLLTPLKKFMPPVSAYYSAADEEKITDILGEHLPYEDAKPDNISRLSRRLRL